MEEGQIMYGYKCEYPYCEGIIKERLVKQEVFKHKTGFIMLTQK